MSPMTGSSAARADFSFLRYAQCWEDADVLLQALAVRPGQVCLSIASAGDNSLSLLAAGAGRVIALDMNPAQLAAVALRVAAYRHLEHEELLVLVGSRPERIPGERRALYSRCRTDLDGAARAFWDAHPEAIAGGIGGAGKFENYFRLFRRWILPAVHGRRSVEELLRPKSREERERFYARHWNSLRWRLLFRAFFSRAAMGRLGRDPAFFDYVEGSVADRILTRVRHALTELDPAENPYAHWILTGTHGTALPHALRPENFAPIRDGLDRFEWHEMSLDALLDARPDLRFDGANLSDIFEYLSPEASAAHLARLVEHAHEGARLAYWNMLAPRSRPETLADRLVPLEELSARLHRVDKAFFYSRFVLEEVIRRADASSPGGKE